MKRILSAALALALSLSLGACSAGSSTSSQSSASFSASSASASESSNPPASSTAVDDGITLRVAALKGPTAIGMVKLMEDASKGEAVNSYEFTLAGSADEITGSIIQGDFDIAAVPTNLAATLYNKTEGKVKMAALNTMGVLYVVEKGDTIHSVADLKGKTVYSTGQGSVPEFALNYILEQNGLTVGTDVLVEYKSEHSELATLMAAGEASVAVLPQPFVTSVLMQNPDVRVALDLTAEWDAASGGSSGLTMGCIVVQQALIDEHPEALTAFLEEYGASVSWVNDSANLSAAAELVAAQGIIAKAPMAEKAIPECNIVFKTAEEMKTIASGFLKVLYDSNPQSVGGILPDEGLYYLAP